MDSAAMSVGGMEFGEGVVEVILNKGGDNIFFACGDDKEMVGPIGVEVVLPSWTRMDTGLWAYRGWSLILLVSLYGCNPPILVRDLAIENHCQFLVVSSV